MTRSFRPPLLTAVAAIVAVCITATAAPAVAAPVTTTSRPIVGDITGDRRADEITLGATPGVLTPLCSARVRPGLVGGGTASSGAFRPLPVRGATLFTCPDLGVVVPGPSPARARLAVAWSWLAPVGGRAVQFFVWDAAAQKWTYDGGTNGMVQPSSLVTQDVDGDGFGDLVERTDQGSGVAVYAGRASTYRQVWTSSPSAIDELSFADFDHHAGVDVLDGHAFYGSINIGVTVVDGATGATVRLVTDTSPFPNSYVPQAVDLDGDGWADVRVRVTADDGTRRPDLIFRNRANGRLSFTGV